ncbi:hypothetical protein [Onishia taeanensis]
MNEPQRLQYLEAMGLTAWVGRYRLPNAALTEACVWEEPASPSVEPPAARLQALIGDAAAPARPAAAPGAGAPDQPPGESNPGQATARADRPADKPAGKGVGRARAMLTGESPAPHEGVAPQGVTREGVTREGGATERGANEPRDGVPAEAPARAAVEASPGEALRFSLQVAALEGRWLLVLPAETPPGPMPRRLLANLLRAAGIRSAELPAFQHFRWPMMDELPVTAPLEEARDGLRAFLDGRRRHGWRPERLLVFGEDATLSWVLALEGETCPLLDLPAWQGPSLEALATDPEAKRALWPVLCRWGEAWQAKSLPDGVVQVDTGPGGTHQPLLGEQGGGAS